MLRALNGDYHVKAPVGKVVLEPVAQQITGIGGSGLHGVRKGLLARRPRERRHSCPEPPGEEPGRSPVTRADIADVVVRRNLRRLRHMLRQADHGGFHRIRPPPPQAMMHVLPPNLAVKHIQVVVMPRDQKRDLLLTLAAAYLELGLVENARKMLEKIATAKADTSTKTAEVSLSANMAAQAA